MQNGNSQFKISIMKPYRLNPTNSSDYFCDPRLFVIQGSATQNISYPGRNLGLLPRLL